MTELNRRRSGNKSPELSAQTNNCIRSMSYKYMCMSIINIYYPEERRGNEEERVE